MAYRRRRQRMHLNADINVVSLIDVMMLLLVIFMLTAPMMQTGLDIHLPEADAQPSETKSALTVLIDANRQIYVNDKPIDLATFTKAFPSYLQSVNDKSGVSFQADSTVSYGLIVSVVNVMRNAGVTGLELATVPGRIVK